MIAPDGSPKVLEFNCRFGDPETQPILFRLKSDLLTLIEAALDGKLGNAKAEWDPRPTVGVVMAAGGYPDKYRNGDPISGPADHTLCRRQGLSCRHRLQHRRPDRHARRPRALRGRHGRHRAAPRRQTAYAVVDQIHWDGAPCFAGTSATARSRAACRSCRRSGFSRDPISAPACACWNRTHPSIRSLPGEKALASPAPELRFCTTADRPFGMIDRHTRRLAHA